MDFTFNGTQLKQRAWNTLRGCYWNALVLAFLASILLGVVSGIVSQIYNIISHVLGIAIGAQELGSSIEESITSADILTAIVVFVVAFLVIMFVSYLLSVFANEPITVGLKKSYLELMNGTMNLDNICNGFTKNYKNVVKASAIKWAYILIGTLCFYIPGIVFYYRYMMVPYILAENPDIDPARALSISRMMMKGNKLKAFILQLSFIGWWLLGCLACGFGTLFVMPYYLMTETELYCELRNQAVASGYVLEAELSGINVMD